MARRFGRKDVGAWLGGNRGTVQSRMPSVGASSDTEAKADVGGGQMEQVRAELGLGAYAFGVGAAGAIGAGVAAVKSGRVVNPVAAAQNLVKGERVIVHGTANPIKGKTLQPTSGSNYSAIAKGNEPMVFGFNPRDKGASTNVPGGAEYYAGRTFNEATGLPIQNPQYNVVVGKATKKAVTDRPDAGVGVVTSSAPVKISGVVKAPSPQGSVTYDQYVKALQKEIRKAGSSLRGEENRLAKRVNDIRRSRKLRNAPGVS